MSVILWNAPSVPIASETVDQELDGCAGRARTGQRACAITCSVVLPRRTPRKPRCLAVRIAISCAFRGIAKMWAVAADVDEVQIDIQAFGQP